MRLLRTLLLVLAGCALAAVATAASVQLSNTGASAGRARALVAPGHERIVLLGHDYRIAGNPGEFPVPSLATVTSTIPEPPVGASLAGVAVLGFAYWARRRRS